MTWWGRALLLAALCVAAALPASAAPHTAKACAFEGVTAAIARPAGQMPIRVTDTAMIEQMVAWTAAGSASEARWQRVYGAPALVSVTLFRGEQFAGMLWLRETDAGLRLMARDTAKAAMLG